MIYILELSEPLGNNNHKARYYIGFVESESKLQARIKRHESGNGAAFTRAAIERGITFRVIATMPGDRLTERKLKNRKNTRRIVEQLQRGIIPQGVQ